MSRARISGAIHHVAHDGEAHEPLEPLLPSFGHPGSAGHPWLAFVLGGFRLPMQSNALQRELHYYEGDQ